MTNENPEESKMGKWTRRGFIGIGGLMGAGLVVALGGYAYVGRAIKKYTALGMGDGNSLNAWIRISPDNKATLAIARAEMGQGVITGVTQLIAEELELDWKDIRVIHPQPESPYANTYLSSFKRANPFIGYGIMDKVMAFLPIVGTGGSTSIIDAWDGMRYAGATAREMLIRAAADKWGEEISSCKAENGFVINTKTNEKLSYGALAEAAGNFASDKLPTLKPRSQFKVIGKPIQRLDIPAKINGTAKFGMDYKMDDMLYAAVKHANITGNKVTGFANEKEVLAMPGVKKVFLTQYGKALVYADNTWRAMNGAKALEVKEKGAAIPDLSSEMYLKELRRLAKEETIAVKVGKGNAKAVVSNELKKGQKKIEATYEVPYLAHACMEPINASAIMKDGKVEAWIGHQVSSVVHTMLDEATGVGKKNIKINVAYLGGGFGRKGEPDYVRLVGAAAKEMPGKLVQLVFSREEDMKNDMYRPASVCELSGVVNEDGTVEALYANFAIQSVEKQALSRILPAIAPSAEKARDTAQGMDDQPYMIPNHTVGFGDFVADIQVGFWRSVGHSQNGFFNESFIDEMAHAANKDPLEFRMDLCNGQERYTKLLSKLKEISGWGSNEENTFQGIALQYSFSSIVGEVAEIEKVGEKEFKIKNYYCVIDCGNTVNPDTIEAQMQSGIIFGLSAAMYGEITWKNGRPVQSNFHDYKMLKMNNCPNIVVTIMENDELPGGVGEPGTPPAAPALANAIFKATGERVRTLPFEKSGYSFV